MQGRQSLPLALTLGLLVVISLMALSLPAALSHVSPQASPAARQLPISFEVNQGQADSQVRFLAHGPGYSLFLTQNEGLLELKSRKNEPSPSPDLPSPAIDDSSALASASPPTLLGMRLLNANPQPEVTGERPLPGIVNYLLGSDPTRWRVNIPTYAEVRYHNIYPGIDLIYYGAQGHLEYNFIVSPGSDPAQIHLSFTGAKRLSLDAQGELLLHLPDGDIPESAPYVYQDINGAQQQIASSYTLQGRTEVGFTVGAYDAGQPLIIDPTLRFSTYLGGLDNDVSTGLAVDSAGNTYVTGSTSSTNFPLQNPPQPAFGGGAADAFVTKMNADGTAVMYSTYLGGSHADSGSSIAVDGAGNAYITGSTFSTDFPTHNALQATFGGGFDDAFVAELNASGTGFVYSTYLGKNGADWGSNIAVDSTGNAYITGGTSSTNFPTHTPLQASNAGVADAFVAKLNAGGAALAYSTYLGGSNYDYGSGIAVDNAGNTYVTGNTHSTNFPTHSPLKSANAGATDAFVAKLNAAGTALVYSTYLGGSNIDSGAGIALDSAGEVYVTGSTHSTNFPTHTPLQSTNAGSTDAFIAKLNASGTALIYATYLGGSNDDSADSIALDSAGSAYITGNTSSTNFPARNALQSSRAGGNDVFVARLNAAGIILLYSSYLGGKSNDEGSSIAVENVGNVYVTGASASSDFPTLNPTQASSGLEDGFLVKMDLTIPAQFQVNPGTINLVTTPGVSPGPQTLTLSNGGELPLNWAANSLPSWVSVSPSSGSLSAGDTQTLTLTFNTPSTTPQAYTTNLVLTDPSASNPPFSLPITVVSASVSKTWYFAEGFTGGSFSEYLTLANPNGNQANVTVQYLIQGASPSSKPYTLSAHSRATINVNTEIGSGKAVSLVVTSDVPIIAERPMYFTFRSSFWNLTIPGGSDVLGATSLGQDFAFGYLDTTTNHDTYLTILNQNDATMDVTIHYFPAAGGASIDRTHSVLAHSRGTIHLNDATENLPRGTYSALVHLSLPGLVERPLYLKDGSTGFTGSADVVGVAQPLTNWDFAEGFTSATFQERYILANPSTTDTASGTITFFLATGASQTTNFTLAPGQQQIINVGVSGNNSAHVHADHAILAERFMSFKFGGTIPGATDVLGAAAPSNLFYFAEGFTGTGFSEYLTIENPSTTNTAIVQVTFLPADGKAPVVRGYTIAPGSRFTLNTATVLPGQSFSMVVESNVAMVAERPMYFTFGSTQTGGSDIIGYQP